MTKVEAVFYHTIYLLNGKGYLGNPRSRETSDHILIESDETFALGGSLAIRASRFDDPDNPPQYITASRPNEQSEWIPQPLLEADLKDLAYEAQKGIAHSDLTIESNIILCMAGIVNWTDALHTFLEDQHIAATGNQVAALALLAPIRDALTEPSQCILRAQRAISTSDALLKKFGAIDTNAEDIKFIAVHRARPFASYAVTKGIADADKAAINNPAYASLLNANPRAATDEAKISLIKKDASRLKALQKSYTTFEKAVEAKWLGDSTTTGLIEHPQFLEASEFWKRDKDWDDLTLASVPGKLT